MPNMDLGLCIHHINPQARYRLSSSVPPHEIVEWLGPGPEPTPAELEAAWAIVSDPDWIDPNLPEDVRKAIEAQRDLAGSPGWADWTVEEAETYIENQVTDLQTAKIVLQALARVAVDLRDFTRILG